MHLLSLSTEVLAVIVDAAVAAARNDQNHSRSDRGRSTAAATMLSALRLTCWRLSAVATPHLYRTVTLRPTPVSIMHWNAILDDPGPFGVRMLVRRVAIESEAVTQDELMRRNWTPDGPDQTELTEDWRVAVNRLGEFGAVDEVHVRFSPECALADTYYEDQGYQHLTDFRGSDPMEQRHEIMSAVFGAMAAVPEMEHGSGNSSSQEQPRRIRSLSIENLQNVVNYELAAASAFKQVIVGLSELHVGVCTETVEHFNENELRLLFVRKFWPSFADTWLRPASPTLTALTIYCDRYFGAVPFWHGGARGSHRDESKSMQEEALELPLLRSLALGSYVLGYEDQLAWLTSLRGLQTLMLHDCPILCVFQICREPGRYEMSLPPVLREKLHLDQTTDEHHSYQSRLSWVKVFDGIRESMLHLDKFIFTPGRWNQVLVILLLLPLKEAAAQMYSTLTVPC